MKQEEIVILINELEILDAKLNSLMTAAEPLIGKRTYHFGDVEDKLLLALGAVVLQDSRGKK